jgi:hypothetical protein
VRAVLSLSTWAWIRLSRRPVDCVAILAAAAAGLIIVVNALFLQSGSHPAPFATAASTIASPPPAASDSRLRAAELPAKPMAVAVTPHSVAPVRAAQPVAARRNDPIAELLGPSPRVLAVQRALSEYGYGQIRPSGVLDEATSTAIEKFERDHKLPVTGQLSDRLVGELNAMVGRPIE